MAEQNHVVAFSDDRHALLLDFQPDKLGVIGVRVHGTATIGAAVKRLDQAVALLAGAPCSIQLDESTGALCAYEDFAAAPAADGAEQLVLHCHTPLA